MDLSELRSRRHMVLTQWDTAKVGEKMADLKSRIAKGEKKPQSVAVSARLSELRAELKKLEREYDIPTEVCDWTFHIAESLKKRDLPAGSSLRISIPGIINLEVDLNANEPPF